MKNEKIPSRAEAGIFAAANGIILLKLAQFYTQDNFLWMLLLPGALLVDGAAAWFFSRRKVSKKQEALSSVALKEECANA